MSNHHASTNQPTDAAGPKKGPPSWLKLIGGALLLVVAFVLALKLASFLIKWGVLVLLLYGGYRLTRHLLADNSPKEHKPTLLIDEEPKDPVMAQIDAELELEELKSRMESAPASDD